MLGWYGKEVYVCDEVRFRQYIAVFLTVTVLFLLTLGSTEAQTPTTTGKAKVDRLVMGLILPYRDYMRPVDQWHPGPQHPARSGL